MGSFAWVSGKVRMAGKVLQQNTLCEVKQTFLSKLFKQRKSQEKISTSSNRETFGKPLDNPSDITCIISKENTAIYQEERRKGSFHDMIGKTRKLFENGDIRYMKHKS